LSGNDQLVQDFLKFDGNAQTLRLVSKLQILADFNGLNLTFGTLSAAMKYTASSMKAEGEHQDHGKRKLGFFTSETKLVDQVREETGTGDSRNPIAFLVEAADDIVYSVADIEDGIKKGVVRWDDIQEELKASANNDLEEVLNRMKRILASSGKSFSELPDDILGSAFRTAAIWVPR
jgi:dGTPase